MMYVWFWWELLSFNFMVIHCDLVFSLRGGILLLLPLACPSAIIIFIFFLVSLGSDYLLSMGDEVGGFVFVVG